MPQLTDILDNHSIVLFATAVDRADAIRQVGALFLASGAAEPGYIDAMLEREAAVSTYVGEGIAFPHGTIAGKALVKRDALAVVTFAGGVDWGEGNRVEVCIGIAAEGRGYIPLLAQLATLLLAPGRPELVRTATTSAEVYAVLSEPVLSEPVGGDLFSRDDVE